MEVTLDKKNNVTASITVKLDETDYQDNVNKALKEHAKKANLKGFRPGKVPVGLIKKMYGKSVLVQEVLRLSEGRLQEYIQEQDIKIVAQPVFSEQDTKVDWDQDTIFEFIYDIGLEPEIDFDMLIQNLNLTKRNVETSDQDVDDYIKNLQDQYGERPEIEISEADDSLIGTFEQGDVVAQGFFKINDVAENLQDKFLGVQADDVVTFDLRTAFPEDEQVENTLRTIENPRSLEGEFTFKVHKITRTNPAQLDIEFFNKVLGENKAENEEEFRVQVKEIIQKYYDIHCKNLLMVDFHHELTSQLNPEFPDDFLRKWLLTNEQITEQNIDESFREFKQNLLWEITRNQACQKHEIEQPSQDDLVHSLKEQFFVQYYNMNILNITDNIMDMFVQQYLQNKENQNAIYGELNRISTIRLLEKIQDVLKIEHVSMSRQEFETFSKQEYEKAQKEQESKKDADQLVASVE